MNAQIPSLLLCLVLWITSCLTGCDTWSRTLQATALLTITPSRTSAEGFDATSNDQLPEDFYATESALVESGLVEFNAVSGNATQITLLEATLALVGTPQPQPLCESAASPGYFTTAPIEAPLSTCWDNPLDLEQNAPYQVDINWKSSVYRLYFPSLPEEVDTTLSLTPEPITETTDSGSIRLGHPKGEDLTLHWTSQSTTPLPPPLIRVDRLIPVTADSTEASTVWERDPQNPVFQNAPFPTSSFSTSVLAHILAPQEDSTLLPGDEIFHISGIYMVSFTPLHLSTYTSDNLHLGSGALSGRTRLLLLHVK